MTLYESLDSPLIIKKRKVAGLYTGKSLDCALVLKERKVIGLYTSEWISMITISLHVCLVMWGR